MAEIILTLGMFSTVSLFIFGAYAVSKVDKETQKKVIAGLFFLFLLLIGTFITMKTVIEPTIIGLKQHNTQQSISTDKSYDEAENSVKNTTILNNDSYEDSQDFNSNLIYILKQPIIIFAFAISIIIPIGKWIYKKI